MKTFTYNTKLWRYQAETAAWYFLTIDKKVSEEIKALVPKKRGWGQVKVAVTIGKTTWKTSIFPSKGEFFLPVKAAIRSKEKVREGDMVSFSFTPIIQ